MKQMMKRTAKIVKRMFPVLLAIVMLLAFATQSLAAAGGNEKPDPGTKVHGNSGQKVKEKTAANEHKQYKGISVEKIALAIDAVTDEAVKAELTALLDAYLTALENKDAALDAKEGSLSELSQIASDTRQALKGALEEAGFTFGSILGWQEWKEWDIETPLDLESIVAAIAALDDADANKAVLAGLLTAYQDALAAFEAADETTEDQAKETMQAARDALLQALYEAGLLPVADAVPPDPDPEEPLPEV
jgi:molecular chaperone GrpE (heat shock protein)